MKALFYFIKLAKPYWPALGLGAFLGGLAISASLILLSVSGWFITTASLLAGFTALLGFNTFLPSTLIRVSALVRTIARYFERLITHNAAFKALADLRIWVYQHCLPLAPHRLGKLEAGSFLSYILDDVEQLDSLYLNLILPLISAFFALLLAFFLISIASLTAGFSFLILALTVFTLFPILIVNHAKKPGEALKQARLTLRSQTLDLIEGMTEIKSFQKENFFLNHMLAQQEKCFKQENKQARLLAFYQMINLLISPLAFLLVFIICWFETVPPGLCVLAGFAGFAAFETLLPLMRTSEFSGKMRASAKALYQLKTLSPKTKINPAPLRSNQKDTAPLPPDIPKEKQSYQFSFQNIGFRYPDSDRFIFKNLSFDFKCGDRLALKGPSGSGKTTLINLFLRFYDIEKGEIMLGFPKTGQYPLNAYPEQHVRTLFSVLDQRAPMLSGDIKTNLRLANPNASDHALWQVLEAAALKDFVLSLPDGLNTWIGAQGALLSAGQRRRLALARAFLKNAPVLLLDEPVEGLDYANQITLVSALEAWCSKDPNHSLVIASHQTEPLKLANKFIELNR